LPGYILPISPAIAIIIGAEIERVLNGDRARMLKLAQWMTALCLLSIGIGLMMFARREAVSLGGSAGPLLFLPLIIAALSAVALGAGKSRAFIAGTAAV